LNKVDYQDKLWESRFIQIPIFKDEVINFREHKASDGVLRFANWTVIMKKIRVPEISGASQAFIESVEKSNGDAYDRTGSVFLIAEDMPVTFLDGMKKGMETIPYYMDETGKKYPGMIRTDEFSPVFELKEDAKNARLRYITTGHGGWGNGDEFVPKPNSIYWNGELVFRFTPWRVDCGSYRL